jgi:putative FmdB family regulatory protein
MPLYEYECPQCEGQKEAIVTSFQTPAPECEVCKVPMVKLISNPGRAHFKGRGFHATEYRSPTRG